ncbi:MAG TPA: class I SAM-dependent methyltransferase [Thermoanaerobaculia bacterium]|nr:class I SAM-dependent methyltransferase [Thermoanaerobaculia bacterium]
MTETTRPGTATIVPGILERYVRAHSAAPSPLLLELEAHTTAHCRNPEMMAGPVEGAFLAMLVRLTGARRVLEIGLFTGYSALSMAEALPEDGRLVSCEIDPGAAAVAQSFLDRSDHGGKIDVRRGPALETLGALPPGARFDLAFLDADKENYVAYYESIVPLLRPGALLVADNVLWSGAVVVPRSAEARALARFNRVVHDDPRVECVLLTVRDGIMLARKRN